MVNNIEDIPAGFSQSTGCIFLTSLCCLVCESKIQVPTSSMILVFEKCTIKEVPTTIDSIWRWNTGAWRSFAVRSEKKEVSFSISVSFRLIYVSGIYLNNIHIVSK